jgi:hypothetical protein
MDDTREAYIISAVRTAIGSGKASGALRCSKGRHGCQAGGRRDLGSGDTCL